MTSRRPDVNADTLPAPCVKDIAIAIYQFMRITSRDADRCRKNRWPDDLSQLLGDDPLGAARESSRQYGPLLNVLTNITNTAADR